MKDEIKREIEKAANTVDPAIFENENQRRLKAAQEFADILERTKLLKGGQFTRKDLADSIKVQKQVQNINPIVLPKLIGNYYYNVYFKGYTKSEQEFIAEHPTFQDSSGHPGVDLDTFSKDLADLLTAKGDAFADAFERLLNHRGMGIATLSGYMYLCDPEQYPLINGASIAGMEYFLGRQHISVIRKYAEEEKDEQGITVQIKNADLRKWLAWSHIIREFKGISVLSNYPIVDYFLWFTNKRISKEKYFAIAFGEDDLENWEEYVKDGYHAIGWSKLNQDLTGLSDEEIEELYKEAYPEQSVQARRSCLYSILRFVHLEPGDMVIANKGKSLLLGAGEVESDYYFEKDAPYYRHRVKVKWTDVNARSIPLQSGWAYTVKVLSEGHFNDLLKYKKGQNPDEAKYFSQELFDWFAGLEANPTKEYYNETKFKFNWYVNTPVKALIKDIAEKLPYEMLLKLETQKRVRANILKNDFGVGNAYDYYWFAFYPKGSSRTKDAQLYVYIDKDMVKYGFSIGEYGKEARNRFNANILQHQNHFLDLVKSINKHPDIEFMSREEQTNGDYKESPIDPPTSAEQIKNWLAEDEYLIMVSRKKQDVLKRHDMSQDIAQVFQVLYPVWLLAAFDTIEDTHIDEDELEELEIYSKAALIADTYFEETDMDDILDEMERKKNIVFYGSPGTGKTFVAKKIAQHLVEGHTDNIRTIQFHQSFAYEDFIEGIRPESKKDGSGRTQIEYPVKAGLFKEMCELAQSYPKQKFVLLIDEFNRGNISKIFGELLYLLEYRQIADTVKLPYSKEDFNIPENVYLIATMNTADRSLTHIDFAMRRRFSFIRFDVNTDILKKWGEHHNLVLDPLCTLLEEINEKIQDENYFLGISFFMCEDLSMHLERIWNFEIFPYLLNFFIDDSNDIVDDYKWQNVKGRLEGISG